MTLLYSQLHARRHHVSQLGNVVKAMRGVAAARAQQSRNNLQNVRLYAEVVAQSMAQVLAIAPDASAMAAGHDGGLALLLFCAEHGFAGAFSERILDAATNAPTARILLIVGTRGARLATARGWQLPWCTPMVSHLASAGALADRISAELYRRVHAGGVIRVDVVHAQPHGSTGIQVVRRPLLPLDYSRFSHAGATPPPLLNLPPRLLMQRLTAEYVFAQLNEAIICSYATENAARLQTMTAARDNISHRLDSLSREERLARQAEITAEIIELAEGAEALGLRAATPIHHG